MSDPTSEFKVFLSELRRRKVVRVGLAYVLVGWVVVEAADTIFPNLGLPPWTVTLVIALGLAGFPVALVLAWALELTPDGVRRTSSVETTPVSAATRSKSGAILWGALIVGVVALAGFFLLRRGGGTGERVDSVAVLPFDDFTAAGDQAHFGAGIAEEILNALSRVEGLRVPSRTTTTILAESGLVLQELGRRLDVEAILEGSVQKHGDSVRVTAQLIRVRDDSHLWSERFEARAGEIFAVQDSIARAVVEAIGLRRGAAGAAPLVEVQTTNPEAYELYLQGRLLLGQRILGSMRASAEFFRRAVALDSGYARAYVGLADAHLLSVNYGASVEEFPRAEARRLAERALELDPDLGAAYASLGLMQMQQGDWRDADANLRAAIALDPGHADPYLWRSYVVLNGRGDLAQAIQLAARAYELEPLMARPGSIYATLLTWTDSAARAVEVAAAIVRVNPANAQSWFSLAQAYVASGDPSQAVEALERALALYDEDYLSLATTFAAAGAHQRARELLARGQAEGASNWEVARLLAALGDIDGAFQLFDRATLPDWLTRGFLEYSPVYAQLRADPRFPALLARFKKELDLE